MVNSFLWLPQIVRRFLDLFFLPPYARSVKPPMASFRLFGLRGRFQKTFFAFVILKAYEFPIDYKYLENSYRFTFSL